MNNFAPMRLAVYLWHHTTVAITAQAHDSTQNRPGRCVRVGGTARGGGGMAPALELKLVARLHERRQAEAVVAVVVRDAHGVHLRRVEADRLELHQRALPCTRPRRLTAQHTLQLSRSKPGADIQYI